MKYSPRIPASFRYLKARFRILTQPEFWGASFGLCLVLVFAWEYFNHPEWLSIITDNIDNNNTQLNTNNNNPLFADDIAAIVVDIDHSSVLKREINPPQDVSIDNSQSSEPPPSPSQDSLNSTNSPSDKSKTELQPLFFSGKPQEIPKASNPFAVAAQEMLHSNYLSGDRSLGMSNQNITITNPLQTALNQISQKNFSNPNSEIKTITNTSASSNINPHPSLRIQIMQPSTDSSVNPTSYPGNSDMNTATNSYTYLTQSQTVPVVPVPTVAPLTVSNLMSAPLQSSMQPSKLNNQTNSGLQFNQLTPSPPNFSIPRAIPGTYIGGGKINTFANP